MTTAAQLIVNVLLALAIIYTNLSNESLQRYIDKSIARLEKAIKQIADDRDGK